MDRKHLVSGALIALISFLALVMLIGASPLLQDGQHRHFYLETAIAQERLERQSTDTEQDARIALALATRQVLPSPTPITLTPTTAPTWTNTPTVTRTPQGIPFTPTQETLTTPFSATPTFSHAINTMTPTRVNTPVATSPLPDANYTCRIITTSALTRRLTPSPSAQSLGVVPTETTLTIHPYDGSIAFGTTFWYVRVADSSGGGWLLYARIDPAAGTLEPRVTEGYMLPVDPLCIPALLR